MSITWKIEIDFDGDGFGVGDDLSAWFQHGVICLGIREREALVADVGRCTLRFDNADKRFSPEYADGPYYGKLRPNLPVRIQVTLDSVTTTLFYGFTSRWQPAPGEYLERACTLECVDMLDKLSRTKFAMPLRENERGDQLAQHVLNYACNAPVASGEINFSGQPADGDTVTVEGLTYTFRTTLSTSPVYPNEVKIGATVEATIDNLAAAIDGAAGVGTLYTAGTTRPATCTAAAHADYFRQVIDDGAVRYYRLGEASGTTAADGGTNNAAGTYLGGVTLGAAGALSGDSDTAASFDGLNDCVSLPTLDMANRSFSLELWFKPASSPPASQDMLTIKSSYATRQSLSLRLYNGTDLAADFYNEALYAPGVLTVGAWNHIVLTYDAVGDLAALYVNGVAVTTGSAGPFEGASPSLTIGALDGQYNFTKGDIDEAALFFTTLSGVRVAAHYAARTVTRGLTLRSTLPGAVGNACTLAKSSSAITLSGATFSGGADWPLSPVPSLETGGQTFDIAGDRWHKDQTDGLLALREITASERGLAWIARNGAFTWKNGSYLFKRVAATPALTLNGELRVEGGLDDSGVANLVIVGTTPRSTATAGAVVAQANATIIIPGQSGTARFDPTKPLVNPGGGSKTIVLKFVDPATGKQAGARDLVLPLVPGTDWTANDRRDGLGTDYTYFDSLSFSVAVTASEAQISVRNTALGPLWLTKLQVRGKLITSYDPLQVTLEDTDSQAAYGLRALSVELPLPVNPLFAESVAHYLLARLKSLAYRIERLETGQYQVGGSSLFAIEIGDVLALSEAQTGVSGAKYIVTGLEYRFAPGALETLAFDVRRLDDQTYGLLDDATYGKFNSTLRFAI